MSRGEPGVRACERRADRVALLRHRRGPSRPAAFRHLGDLGLREQHEIEGDLRGDTGSGGERGAELRDASPVRVPGKRREPEGRARVRRGRAARRRRRRSRRAFRRLRRAAPRAVRRETCSSRTRASTTAVSQPAALRPNVVGTACCRSVRATISVSRCSRASAAAAAATRSASASTSASARRETSIAAVSTMSWLVAPRCTYRAASSPTEPARARTSGSTGLPTARPSVQRAARSRSGRGRRRRRSRSRAAPERCRRSRRRSRAHARRRAALRATPGARRRPVGRRGRRGRRTPTCRDRSGSRLDTARVSRFASRLLEQRRGYSTCACDIQHANGRPRGGRARLGGP